MAKHVAEVDILYMWRRRTGSSLLITLEPIHLSIGRGHFFEAAHFDELADDGEVTPSRPRGVPFCNRRISRDKSPSLIIMLPVPLVTLELRSNKTR